MAQNSLGVQQDRSGHHPASGNLKIISWNLLRLIGAGVRDVAALIEQQRPDVLLMQEATVELENLPSLVGGYMVREPMHRRVYGLAAWSPYPLTSYALPLPVSAMPGRVPPRVAQIVRFGNLTLANVHLSHGQFLNRWQLLHIARALEGPAAIVGDYNAVGPIMLDGFKDIGPRQPTHIAGNVISFRLDRCMGRGLHCKEAQVLARGPSDHHPIKLDLDISAEVVSCGEAQPLRRVLRLGPIPRRAEMASWLRALALSPNRIRVQNGAAGLRQSRRFRRKAAHGALPVGVEKDGPSL